MTYSSGPAKTLIHQYLEYDLLFWLKRGPSTLPTDFLVKSSAHTLLFYHFAAVSCEKLLSSFRRILDIPGLICIRQGYAFRFSLGSAGNVLDVTKDIRKIRVEIHFPDTCKQPLRDSELGAKRDIMVWGKNGRTLCRGGAS